MVRTILGLILAAVILIFGYNFISGKLSDYMDNGETSPIDLDAENYISENFRADDFLYDCASGFVAGLYEDSTTQAAGDAEAPETTPEETPAEP